MKLLEELQGLDYGQRVFVNVNTEVKDTLNLLNFQQQTLEMELQAVRENRYGFYNRDSVIQILTRLEDKRVEREQLFHDVGVHLLGDDYRSIMDELGVEFQIDTALPVIVFFKVG